LTPPHDTPPPTTTTNNKTTIQNNKQSPKCEIGVTLLDATSSDGHKFKVSGLMMNEYTGKDVTTKIHEEKWLGDLQATSGRRRRR
jgi:hypothetical protein